jgi:transcriptional regulator with XRE-family HTH domain
MAELSKFARNSILAQEAMFRLAKRDHGLSTARLAELSDISKSTLDGWASGNTAMPAWALGQLDIPVHLKSLVLAPFGFVVSEDAADADTVHEAARLAADLISKFSQAVSPESPGGVNITPSERAKLADTHDQLASIRIAR